MLNFEITYKSTFSVQWPKIKVYNNDKLIKEIECNNNKFTFSIEPDDKNKLIFDWYNKTEKHTKTTNGSITQDQTFELINIRADSIQLENWIMTEGTYEPRYFKGFIKQCQEQRINYPLEKRLKSQLIWHFPGQFIFLEFYKEFWDWYYVNKIQKEVVKFTNKDPERIFKYRGSLDPCTDLVKKLKELIK